MAGRRKKATTTTPAPEATLAQPQAPEPETITNAPIARVAVHACPDNTWGVRVILPDGGTVQKRATSQKSAEAFARAHVERLAPGAAIVLTVV